MGFNVTPCNWGVLFAPKVGVSLKSDKESPGANEIFRTDCEKFRIRIAVSIQFVYYFWWRLQNLNNFLFLYRYYEGLLNFYFIRNFFSAKILLSILSLAIKITWCFEYWSWIFFWVYWIIFYSISINCPFLELFQCQFSSISFICVNCVLYKRWLDRHQWFTRKSFRTILLYFGPTYCNN